MAYTIVDTTLFPASSSKLYDNGMLTTYPPYEVLDEDDNWMLSTSTREEAQNWIDGQTNHHLQ